MSNPVLTRGALTAATLLFASACASTQEPAPTPTPIAAAPAAVAAVQPPADAIALADQVKLSGVELGTMWTFENPPLEYWRRTYGFDATPQWLEHVRLSSVRYGTYCSASFVSPTGLVMTNHHCARECVEAVSTADKDYVIDGFYAGSRAEEQVCPGLFLDQLVDIQDVTEQVKAAGRTGAGDEARTRAMEEVEERLETECETRGGEGTQCQVVSLFHGGQYKLYRYKRYEPVKLVFAPELQAAFFGGDPDNFTYPRYDLDVSFVRAYEAGGQPASTPHFFEWSQTGARDGDLVFVTGNPGSTTRQVPVSRVMYERRFEHPFIVDVLRAQRQHLQAIAASGPDAERQVRDQLFGVENSLKKYEGELAGLNDVSLLAEKIRWQREFRGRVDADAQLRATYGDVWNRLEAVHAEMLEVQPALFLASPNFFGLGAPQVQVAFNLVRYVRQAGMPDAERLPAYRGDSLAVRRQRVLAEMPLDAAAGTEALDRMLAFMSRWLQEDDPTLRLAIQQSGTTTPAARTLIDRSRIGETSFRTELVEGGVTALDASDDPLIVLARGLEARQRQLQRRMQELNAAETIQQQRFAEALFAVYGTDLPPDATFTLRITDGIVRGYPYNGTLAPWATTLFGLFDRAASFNNEMPFKVPDMYAARRTALDLSVPYNFVATTDITGGNSGSPMIDRNARVVGIAFDGNIESLPNEYLFRTLSGRTVGVHSRGILEALRNVYRTEALLNEIVGARRP